MRNISWIIVQIFSFEIHNLSTQEPKSNAV